MDKRTFELRLRFCGKAHEDVVTEINQRGKVSCTKASLSKAINSPEYPHHHSINREAEVVTLAWVEARRSQIIDAVKLDMEQRGMHTDAEITVPLCIDSEAPVLVVGDLVCDRVIGYWSDRDGFREV